MPRRRWQAQTSSKEKQQFFDFFAISISANGHHIERVYGAEHGIFQEENIENCLIPSLNFADFPFALDASSSLNLECRFCTFIELNKMGI